MIALAFVLLTAGAANAQLEQAKVYFDAGQLAYRQGEYATAAAAFEEANELAPNAALLFSAAQAHRLQYATKGGKSHLESAASLYRRYLRLAPHGRRSEDAAEHLVSMDLQLFRLSTLTGTAAEAAEERARTQILVSSPTPDAYAQIDGNKPKPVPLIQVVAPGKHTVRVFRLGFVEQTREMIAVEGRLRVAEIELVEQPAKLTIAAPLNTRITIDRRAAIKAPVGTIKMSSGRHMVTARARGKETISREVTLERGEEAHIAIQLKDTGQRTVSYWVLGTAAAMFTATVATGVAAGIYRGRAELYLQKRDFFPEELFKEDLERYQKDRTRQDQVGKAFVATAVTTLALTALGTALFVLDSPSTQSLDILAGPVISPDYQGVGAAVSF